MRHQAEPTTMTLPAKYIVCRKHNDIAVAYSREAYKQCPLCAAQHALNPELKSTSPQKNGSPNKQVRTNCHTDESVRALPGGVPGIENTDGDPTDE